MADLGYNVLWADWMALDYNDQADVIYLDFDCNLEDEQEDRPRLRIAMPRKLFETIIQYYAPMYEEIMNNKKEREE